MMRERRFFYGWIIVAMVPIHLMLVYGIRHSFAVFYSSIIDEFSWSRGNIAIMFSLNLLFYGFSALLAGLLINRFNVSRVIYTGFTILSLATACCGLADKLWHFYVLFGFFVPLGTALCGWPILWSTLMNWFIERRGLVLGLAQIGGGLSFAYAIFAEWVISHVGWRWAYFILAGVLWVLLLPLVHLFFRYRPEEMSLKPYGFKVSVPTGGPLKETNAGKSFMGDPEKLREILKMGKIWLLLASEALYWGVGVYLVLAHQVKFAQDVGYSGAFSVSVFSLSGVAQIFGNVSGFVSDRVGREKAITLSTALCVAALLALISVQGPSQSWLLYLYAICFGYGAGLFNPAMMAATADLFYGRHFGAVSGLFLTALGIGGALGPWLGGYLHDLLGSYRIAFLLSSLCMSVGCILVWIAGPRKVASRRVTL
jgi:MFS family permease